MKEFIKDNSFLIIGFLLICAIKYGLPTDSTDQDRFNRSGLSLYIDHGTGVHYIKGGIFGTIVPRLNIDGTLYKEKK